MIRDPATGQTAAVTDNRQVKAFAEAITDRSVAVRDSRAFFANSPVVTLTTATQSGVFYIENTGDKNLEIDSMIVTFGVSTGGTGAILVSGSRNDTGGTVKSAGTAVGTTCQNFGTSASASAEIKAGAQGSTIGSALSSGAFVAPMTNFEMALSRIVLPKGSSFAIAVTPPTGNTSLKMTVRATLIEVV